jgi:hypothetical protein
VRLFDNVQLTQDVPEHGLRAGDVATLVDRVPPPGGGEEGGVLEFFDTVGESLAVVVVPLSALAPCEPVMSGRYAR